MHPAYSIDIPTAFAFDFTKSIAAGIFSHGVASM